MHNHNQNDSVKPCWSVCCQALAAVKKAKDACATRWGVRANEEVTLRKSESEFHSSRAEHRVLSDRLPTCRLRWCSAKETTHPRYEIRRHTYTGNKKQQRERGIRRAFSALNITRGSQTNRRGTSRDHRRKRKRNKPFSCIAY